MPKVATSFKALLLSLGLHAGILAVVAWPDPPRAPQEPEIVWLSTTRAAAETPPRTAPRQAAPAKNPPTIRKAAAAPTRAAKPAVAPLKNSSATKPPPPASEALASTPAPKSEAAEHPNAAPKERPSDTPAPPTIAPEGLPSEALAASQTETPPTPGPSASPMLAADSLAAPSQDELAAYLGELVALLEAQVHYPLQARRLHWEGRSVLRCTLSREGELRQVELAASSGRKLLDAAALRACQQLGQLPPYPAGAGETLTLEIPITFKLN